MDAVIFNSSSDSLPPEVFRMSAGSYIHPHRLAVDIKVKCFASEKYPNPLGDRCLEIWRPPQTATESPLEFFTCGVGFMHRLHSSIIKRPLAMLFSKDSIYSLKWCVAHCDWSLNVVSTQGLCGSWLDPEIWLPGKRLWLLSPTYLLTTPILSSSVENSVEDIIF